MLRDPLTLQGIQYTHTVGSKVFKLFGCAKRGCDQVNPDWWAFRSGNKTYCLDHKPLLARLRLWWQKSYFRLALMD